MARRALLLLLLLLGLLAGSEACSGRDYSCSFNQVRGPNNSTGSGMVDIAGIGHMCIIGHSVVAATFTDIRRLRDSYLIRLEMPGVGIGGVTVRVDSAGVLSIAGLSQEVGEPRFQWERGAFTKLFARKFLLPPHVDVDGISHQLEHGLLRVTLPIRPGFEETSSSEQGAADAGPPFVEEHIPFCYAEHADEIVQPQALVGWNKPERCNHGVDRDSCRVIIKPLVDMLQREDDRVLLMVAEMPGVRSAKVEVECKPGRMPEELTFKTQVDRSTPGCIVSVRGVVEEEGEGELVRAERGARWKVFQRSLHFEPPETVQLPYNGVYELSDGLLKVPLRRVQHLSAWGYVAEFGHRLFNAVKLSSV